MAEQLVVTVAGERLLVSGHARDRYRDRVRPDFTRREIRVELERVLPLGEITGRPAWVATDVSGRFLVLAGGICFPIEDGCLLTCLARGGVGDEMRAERNDWRRRRRVRARESGRDPYGGRSKAAERARRDRERGAITDG